MGDTHIDAYVKEVRTALGAGAELRVGDLPLKRHERIFHERVPLPAALRDRIQLYDEWRYAELSVLIEAWGLRASYARERLLSRPEIAVASSANGAAPCLGRTERRDRVCPSRPR